MFITAFLAYWQVITFSNCLKWDMVDQYFPWRYHVVSCLRGGELPLWNPYNFGGYPTHADPQSGAWYMPLWFFALFGSYGPQALAIDVFAHIWLAGIGMYLLVNYLYKNHAVALIAAVSYIGCGVLVGNAQHFTYIISACWLPFVILFFIKLLNTINYRDALKLALFLWLLFTGGYPAFFIISGYILGVASLGYYVYQLHKNEKPYKLIGLQLLALLVFVLLSLPSIVSFALYWNDTTRSGGILLAEALFGPFRLQDVPSVFVPMLSAIKKENTGTDISMMNGYFGLIPLVALGFIIPYFKQLKPREVFILSVSIVCLLAAFGDTFVVPMRQWLYHLPGLNIFRFPAIFRLFCIVGFTLVGAWVLLQIQQNEQSKKWKYGVFCFITGIVLALAFRNVDANNLKTDIAGFHFIWIEFPGSAAAAVVGGVVQLVCLVALFLFWRNYKALVAIAVVNTIVATQLNVPTTVINKEPLSDIASWLDTKPDDHFINTMRNGDVDSNRQMGNEHFEAPSPLWRNLGIFYKQPSFDGNNPFRLRNFALLEESPAIDSLRKLPIASSVDTGVTFAVSFDSPNSFRVRYTPYHQQITVLQNTQKYWDVIDYFGSGSQPAKIKYIGNTFPAVLNADFGTLRFTYNPPFVARAFWCSLLLLPTVLLLALYKKKL